MTRHRAEIQRDAPFGPFRWHIVIIRKPGSGASWIEYEVARSCAWTRRGAEARARRIVRRIERRAAQAVQVEL